MTKKTNKQIGRMARRKGANGEREFARVLTDLLNIEHIRAAQRNGLNVADVITADPGEDYGIHWEVKRVENLDPYKAVEQAKGDCKSGDSPAVGWRKNDKEWLAVVPLASLADFCSKFYLALAQGK